MEVISVGVKEAAKLCGIAQNTLYDFIKNDATFPAFAIGQRGGVYIIPVEELRRWINEKGRRRDGLRKQASKVVELLELAREERKSKKKGA